MPQNIQNTEKPEADITAVVLCFHEQAHDKKNN